MSNTNYKDDYVGFLDGLRGLLALWVLTYHLSMTVLAKPTPWGNGAVAVDIFMLLSGFLMAYHWELRKDRFTSFFSQTIDFWIRRFFRITPVYWTLLIGGKSDKPYHLHGPPMPAQAFFRHRL